MAGPEGTVIRTERKSWDFKPPAVFRLLRNWKPPADRVKRSVRDNRDAFRRREHRSEDRPTFLRVYKHVRTVCCNTPDGKCENPCRSRSRRTGEGYNWNRRPRPVVTISRAVVLRRNFHGKQRKKNELPTQTVSFVNKMQTRRDRFGNDLHKIHTCKPNVN